MFVELILLNFLSVDSFVVGTTLIHRGFNSKKLNLISHVEILHVGDLVFVKPYVNHCPPSEYDLLGWEILICGQPIKLERCDIKNKEIEQKVPLLVMDLDDEIFKERSEALLRALSTTRYIVPCQIEEGLYLGSLGAAKNKSALKSLNITHVLIVACLLQPLHPNDFTYRIVDVADRGDTNLSQYFDECFNFIEEAKSKGGVLVHYVVGKSRSVTIVVAYLMKKHGMSLVDALHHVKSKRPLASHNPGFMSQLQKLEGTIREMKVLETREVQS